MLEHDFDLVAMACRRCGTTVAELEAAWMLRVCAGSRPSWVVVNDGHLVQPWPPAWVGWEEKKGMTCPLCGFDQALGEHGIYRMDLYSGDVAVCKPVVVVRNPRRLGVITGITGGPDEEKKGSAC